MVAILMMSAKLATLDLLKVNSFRNKGYDVISYIHDVANFIILLKLYCRCHHVTKVW